MPDRPMCNEPNFGGHRTNGTWAGCCAGPTRIIRDEDKAKITEEILFDRGRDRIFVVGESKIKMHTDHQGKGNRPRLVPQWVRGIGCRA